MIYNKSKLTKGLNMNQLSNCCGANLSGEPYTSNLTGTTTGRCGDCKEHCGVVTQVLVNQIKSFYPMGTTDGISYTVKPRV